MNVRSCEPGDVAAVACVFTESVHGIDAAHYSSEQLATWAPEPPDIEYWRERMDQLIGFVAEIDFGVVGFVTFDGFITSDAVGHLDHLYVLSSFQRRGVATALCQRVEQEARTRGVRYIFTDASLTSRPFFERIGFQMIGPRQVVRRGVCFTNYRMEKALS